MHRQHHHAGRGVRRLHRRGGHGSRHRLRVGHRLRRQRHHHRRRGSYRRHHRRRGVHHRLERRDGRWGRRVGDHRDAADGRQRPGAGACCLVRRHRGAGRRDAGLLGAVPAGAEWPARRAAPRRTGCFRPAGCALPASGPPGAGLGSAQGWSGSAPERLLRPAAVRQPVPAVAPAAREPVAQRVWGQRAWPPGPRIWPRALRPSRHCRRPSPVRACRHRMIHAVAARRVLPPSTTRI
jgi:hypothetical protein